MITRTLCGVAFSLVLAAATVAGSVPQAAGSISGTVTVAAQSSNADAVVFVERAGGTFAPGLGSAVLDQKSLKFVPHVLPVRIGTTVRFNNSDTVAHNVFSPDFEKYNLGTFGPGLSRTHVFAKCAKAPCVYTQLCLIHPEMEAFIVVLQNPYFATTNDAGQFTISGVPPGQYQVGAWHAKGKAAPKTVTVEAGKTATINLALAK